MCCPNNPTEAANCETVLIPYLGMLDKIISITFKNRTVASFDIFTFSSDVANVNKLLISKYSALFISVSAFSELYLYYQIIQMGNKYKENKLECQELLPILSHVTTVSVYMHLKNKYGGKITNKFDDYHISKQAVEVRIEGERMNIEFIHVVLSDCHYLELENGKESDKYYYEHNHFAYLVTDIAFLTVIDQYIKDEIETFMEEWEQTYIQYSDFYMKDEDSNYYTIITQPKF